LTAITAAVVGVILNLAIWFGIHTIFSEVRPVEWGILNFDAPAWGSVNLWALLLSTAAIVAMFRFKIGMLRTLAATSVAGIALYASGAIA
jgi:chromate transporter